MRTRVWKAVSRHVMRSLIALVVSFVTANLFAGAERDRTDLSYGGIALLPVRYMEWPSPDAEVAVLRLGLISARHSSVKGIDLGTIVNYTDCGLYGMSVSLFNCHGESYGIQTGLVNATGVGGGLQIGFWNLAEDYAGLQIGFANFAHQLKGVQIGVGNVITDSPFQTCIIMNACF